MLLHKVDNVYLSKGNNVMVTVFILYLALLIQLCLLHNCRRR
jgi:hypothetical protein